MRAPSRPPWLTFRGFAAFTTGLTLTLIVLGIYTAATGSGLACSQQWPLCDGGVLPNSLPSFIEWFHRLVAMITGWFILGTAAWSWRAQTDRRTRTAATLSAVLLPLQIGIGAVTVTLNGALPSGYSTPTHAAHLAVALLIFGALVLTTLFASDSRDDRPPLASARRGLLMALFLLPISAAFSRVTVVPAYSPRAQAFFYGLSLLVVAALLAATVLLGRTAVSRLRWGAGAALAATLAHLLLGRDLVFYTPAVRRFNVVLLFVSVALLAATTWAAYRHGDVGLGVDGSTPVRGE